jgi:hypothetical protein
VVLPPRRCTPRDRWRCHCASAIPIALALRADRKRAQRPRRSGSNLIDVN